MPATDPAVQARIAAMQQQANASSGGRTPPPLPVAPTAAPPTPAPFAVQQRVVQQAQAAPGTLVSERQVAMPAQGPEQPGSRFEAITTTPASTRAAGITEVARLNQISETEAAARYDRAMAFQSGQTTPPPGTVYDAATGKAYDPRTGNVYAGSVDPNFQGMRFVEPTGAAAGSALAARPGSPGAPGAPGSGLAGTGQTLDTSGDPRMKILDDLQKQQESRYNETQRRISDQFEQGRRSMEQQQRSQTGQTSVMLARMGALGSTGSGVAYMNSLEVSHQGALGQLESQRQSAIFDAEDMFNKDRVELAFKRLDTIDKISEQAVKLSETRKKNLALGKEVSDKNLGQLAQAGYTSEELSDSGYFDYLDQEAKAQGVELPKGYSKRMFETEQKVQGMKLEKAGLQNRKMVVDMAKDIYGLINDAPPGQILNIGGEQYFGTGKNAVSIDEDGIGRAMLVDPNTGEVTIRNYGKFGKAEAGSFEMIPDDYGGVFIFNKKTGQYVSDTDSPTITDRWSKMIPDGTKGGQCGTFVRMMTGLVDPKTGLIPNELAGKVALTDPALLRDPSRLQIGDTFVQSTNQPWGHIGLINAIDKLPNGRIQLTLTESNYKLDERVTNTRKMFVDDPSIKGFASTSGSLSEELTGEAGPPAPTRGPRFMSAAQKKELEGKEDLSVAEAKELGLPFGTTRAEAKMRGITPKKDEADAKALSFTDLEKINERLPTDKQLSLGATMQDAKDAGVTPGKITAAYTPPAFEKFAKEFEQAALKDPSITSISQKRIQQLYDNTFKTAPSILDAASVAASGLPEKRGVLVVSNIKKAIESGNIEGAKEQLKNAALSSVSTGEQEKIRGRDVGIQQLTKIKDMLSQMEKLKPGSTDIFKGTEQKIKERAGTVGDPELRKLATQISSTLIDYRKSVSGAAFTESEQKEYAEIFPSISGTYKLNIAKVEGLVDSWNSGNSAFYRSVITPTLYDEIFAQ